MAYQPAGRWNIVRELTGSTRICVPRTADSPHLTKIHSQPESCVTRQPATMTSGASSTPCAAPAASRPTRPVQMLTGKELVKISGRKNPDRGETPASPHAGPQSLHNRYRFNSNHYSKGCVLHRCGHAQSRSAYNADGALRVVPAPFHR